MTLPQRILVLTGSGISAESGISTYRGGADGDKGLWSQVDFQKYASPEGFAEDPEGVQDFYNIRRTQIRGVKPNPAHFALARLQAHLNGQGGCLTLVTQNVDDLHERAGAQTLHMHGEILKGFCDACNSGRFTVKADLATTDACQSCGQTGRVRPDVVWFGEMPYHMDAIYAALSSADLFVSIGTSGAVYPAAGFVQEAKAAGITTIETDACQSCGQTGRVRPDVVWFGEMPYHMDAIYAALSSADLFVSIGTSGAVYPAAGFVQEAKAAGITTIELNLEPSDNHWAFDEAIHGPAAETVPKWAARWGL